MKKNNVIIIVCHDLGQHIGPYGVETVNTPNLDRMARQGTLYRNNHCVSPGCSPSRAAIFTGRYPHSNGVMGLTHADFLWRFNQGEKHLAQVLGNAGWRTILLGNWHENNRIDNVGYQQTVVRNADGMALCNNVNQNIAHPNALELAERVDYGLGQLKDTGQPFYLYAGIFEPHRPFDFEGCEPDDEKGVWIPPYIPQKNEQQKSAARKEFAELQGCIKRMDQAVGTILDSIEKNGLKESTLVLFTADHGVAMPRAKCTLYDPGTETPLILWGGGVPENVQHGNLISNVDYFPTLMDYCGLPAAENVQGQSFYPQLTGKPHEPRTAVFAEKTYHRDYDPIRSIRTEKYKFIINFELNFAYDAPSDIQKGDIYRASIEEWTGLRPRVELYDLDADPWEQNNLAEKPDMNEVRADLQQRLVVWMKQTDDPLLNGPVRSIYCDEILTMLQRQSG